MKRPHPTVQLHDPYHHGEVDVDKGLAPLIKILWQFGIVTDGCCQECPQGKAYISMPYEAAMRLSGLVFCRDSRLYYEGSFSHGGNWDWELHQDDGSILWDETKGDSVRVGPPNFTPYIIVRFPTTDIPEILEQLKKSTPPAWRRG